VIFVLDFTIGGLFLIGELVEELASLIVKLNLEFSLRLAS